MNPIAVVGAFIAGVVATVVMQPYVTSRAILEIPEGVQLTMCETPEGKAGSPTFEVPPSYQPKLLIYCNNKDRTGVISLDGVGKSVMNWTTIAFDWPPKPESPIFYVNDNVAACVKNCVPKAITIQGAGEN